VSQGVLAEGLVLIRKSQGNKPLSEGTDPGSILVRTQPHEEHMLVVSCSFSLERKLPAARK